jgi:hypothetical protein
MLTKNPSSILCLLYCITWMEGRCLPCEPAQSTTRASRPRRAGTPIPYTTTCPALTRGGAAPVARPGGDAGAGRGRRLTGIPGDGSRSAGGATWGPFRRLQLTGPPHLPASLRLLHSAVRGPWHRAVPYTRTQRIGSGETEWGASPGGQTAAYQNSAQIGKWSEAPSASASVTISQADRRLVKEGRAKM